MAVKRFLIVLGALSLVAPALASGQSPQRGWVGVAYTTAMGQADQNGNMIFSDYPVIESIEPGSPAQRAGLRAGDTILAINSQDLKKYPLPSGNMLQPGRKMVFRLRRDFGTREIAVRVAPRPAGTSEYARVTIFGPEGPQPKMSGRPPVMGRPDRALIEASAILPQIFDPGTFAIAGARLMRLDENLRELLGVKSGVMVLTVGAETPAMRAGLRSTDVIIRAGQSYIENPGEIARLMTEADVNDVKSIKLQIIRKKKPQTVTLRW